MAHRCFSCRKQAWNSAAEEAEPQTPLVLLQESFGPWALPCYPKLGDPFHHNPEFSLELLHCFCRLPCWNCSGSGPLFEGCCGRCPERSEPQPSSWTPMEAKEATGEVGAADSEATEDVSPGASGQIDALGTSQETKSHVREDLLEELSAVLHAQPQASARRLPL